MRYWINFRDFYFNRKTGEIIKTKPDKNDKIDIKKAIKTLGSLGKYDFSQGAVVRKNKVLAIESKSGTQKMLHKIKNKKL